MATTHLERSPDSADAQVARGFQYGSIFRELLAFASANDAEEVPVVLTGDLNAKDCDELAGTARALVRLLKSPTHPLLWSVMDAPTPATTVTEERQMRIDYLLYQSAAVSLTGVGQLPRLHAPIPDEVHPSDHLPVSARLVLRSKWAQVEEDARQWLACVSGTTTVRPLSPNALRLAFDYFDKDASGYISHVELEAGMQTLGFPGLDTSSVRKALIASGCTPCYEAADGSVSGLRHGKGHMQDVVEGKGSLLTSSGSSSSSSSGVSEQELSWAMDLDSFVHVYTDAVRQGSSAMARQLEKAFQAFDPSGKGVLAQDELRNALRRMASAPLDEERLDDVLHDLGSASATGIEIPGHLPITIKSFSEWMMDTYTSYLKDPSLITDSLKTPGAEHVYNQ